MTKNQTSALIIIARSGAGKTTLTKELTALSESHKKYTLKVSVSDTTRPMKIGEADGIQYNFISLEEFERRKENDYYIETDKYAENWYGSPKNQFLENKAHNIITIYDVEANGAEAIQGYVGSHACCIVRLDVPLDELQKRVAKRNRDSEMEKRARVVADNARIAKMLMLATPIAYGHDVVPASAANEIYNLIDHN